jgi:hypothetical protein
MHAVFSNGKDGDRVTLGMSWDCGAVLMSLTLPPWPSKLDTSNVVSRGVCQRSRYAYWIS